MTEAELFVCAVAKRLDLVFVQNKIAVRTEQVIGHQISVVRRSENLTWERKESFADFERKLEVVKGIELINKDECCISHPFHPKVQ